MRTPYYCRYVRGTDSENFTAFLTAKHPNGLESDVETIDRILEFTPNIQELFRATIDPQYQPTTTRISTIDPRSAARELVKYYQGEELKCLINLLSIQ